MIGISILHCLGAIVEVHFAAAGSSMPAALKGAPLKAIYYTYKTSTFQLIVRPEIAGPQNLKGKAIAVSSPGSSNDQAACSRDEPQPKFSPVTRTAAPRYSGLSRMNSPSRRQSRWRRSVWRSPGPDQRIPSRTLTNH